MQTQIYVFFLISKISNIFHQNLRICNSKKVIRLHNALGLSHATFDLNFTPQEPESESRLRYCVKRAVLRAKTNSRNSSCQLWSCKCQKWHAHLSARDQAPGARDLLLGSCLQINDGCRRYNSRGRPQHSPPCVWSRKTTAVAIRQRSAIHVSQRLRMC